LGESKARTGAAVAAAGAALLIISLFLDWYQLELPPEGGRERSGPSFTAWVGLERTDIYLLVIAIATLFAAVVLVANWIRESNAAQITVLLLGLAALFLVLYRGLNAPERVIFGVPLDTSLQIGWFLALISAGLIAVGGAVALDRRPAREGRAERAEGAEPAEPAEPGPPAS
jgi:hypothetical protein